MSGRMQCHEAGGQRTFLNEIADVVWMDELHPVIGVMLFPAADALQHERIGLCLAPVRLDGLRDALRCEARHCGRRNSWVHRYDWRRISVCISGLQFAGRNNFQNGLE